MFPEKIIDKAGELSRNVSLHYDTNEEKYGCSFFINDKKSYSRMVSYWNAYYRRRCRDLKKYVGYKIFKEHFGYYVKQRF